jgi:nicotinamidase-related amidase
MQLNDFMDEQAKINKDTATKFKAIDKVLENINSKVTEVRISNHQVFNMMKMLETQVGQPQLREASGATSRSRDGEGHSNSFGEGDKRSGAFRGS